MTRLHTNVAFAAAVVGLAACGKGEVKSYPDGSDGLKAFMTDLAAADETLGDRMAKSLALADPEGWFKTQFGDTAGKALAEEYVAGTKGDGLKSVRKAFQTQRALGYTVFLAERFDDGTDANAVGYQEAALQAAKQPLALYSFRAVPPGGRMGWHLYNFVYMDGTWKFVGPMKGLNPQLRDEPMLDGMYSMRVKDRRELTGLRLPTPGSASGKAPE